MPTGVYVTTNDKMFQWSLAFFESFRALHPDTPLVVIPFDDDMDQIKKLQKFYDFDFMRMDLAKIDQTAARMFPDHRVRRQIFRKLAAFSGVLDYFVHIDVDVILLKSLDKVFSALEGRCADVVFSEPSNDWCYRSDVVLPEFTHRSRCINGGFFGASRAVATTDDMMKFFKSNIDLYRNICVVEAAEQSFMNMYFDQHNMKVLSIDEVVPSQTGHSFYLRDFIRQKGGGLIDSEGREVVHIHWAGANKDDVTLPYSDFRLHFHGRGLRRLQRMETRVVTQPLPGTICAGSGIAAKLSQGMFNEITDIPGGQTSGDWDFRPTAAAYVGGVEVAAKRVLDVNCMTGFFSFYFEARGAEVVSHEYCSGLTHDITEQTLTEELANSSRADIAYWPRITASYWFCHSQLHSKAALVHSGIQNIPEEVGVFDIVFWGHRVACTRDIVGALSSLAKLACDRFVLVGAFEADPASDCYSSLRLKRNWLSPSPMGLREYWDIGAGWIVEFLQSVGFTKADVSKSQHRYVPTATDVDLTTIVAWR